MKIAQLALKVFRREFSSRIFFFATNSLINLSGLAEEKLVKISGNPFFATD
ncbi:hypothetical protein [Flavobacterium sp. N502540]|uniref:hypothetical protein n=1 Tax=Flavobacterium sp. N502540 TaxID=2986838 RepID=UPI002224FDED|nr:hypothetical protein [Flavobacterium sp. N502540]